ncbi:PREDICTED: uncharacterized protein LOC107161486 [Diuraphis noxia]|uniref:uncharacterized protein LOC107161486 n=1 Tax=Diuraphis noxia TaxID=143948 RepID=UPI0007637F0F|nr:PREDICTED: uncharacterized protein LOC107161486 [Diuraphis noxia]
MENTAVQIHVSRKKDEEDKEEDYCEEENTHILELRALKESILSRFSSKVTKSVTFIIDELLCETIFNIHKELKLRVLDPRRFDTNYRRNCLTPTLVHMAEHLNISTPNQEVECPKCFISVKCFLLSKHLALCMNPQQSNYSYSSRSSSRIARQRIQEGFKTAYDESKNDSDDEQIKPKRRSTKGKKSTIKNIKGKITQV